MEKLLTLLAFLPFAVFAQPVVSTVTLEHLCSDTQYTFEQLKNKHDETPIMTSIVSGNSNMVISIWHNPKTKTVTVVQTSIMQNLSCVIAAGEDAKLLFKYD